LVFGQPGMDGQCDFGGLSEVLREYV